MKPLYLYLWYNFLFVIKIFFLVNTFLAPAQTTQSSKLFDFYYSKAQEKSFNLDTRKQLLHKATYQIPKTSSDSLKYWQFSKVAVTATVFNDSLLFHQVSTDALILAQKLDIPRFLADVHWNYGAFYLHQKKYDRSYSHYSKAYEIYIADNDTYYSGKMLYNLAYISSMVKDYTGAEIQLFKAIRHFEKGENHKQLYRCFNLLGTVSENLGEFQEAINYYEIGYKYIPEIVTPNYEHIEFWNNMGLISHRLENYEEAINYFNKGLANKAFKPHRPALFAKLIDNRAFSLFMMGRESTIIEDMFVALAIRDSIGDTAGSVINRIHIAKYYAKQGDSIQAILFAKNAFDSAFESNLNRDILQALELLASLDTKHSNDYLRQHIELNKVLKRKERAIRNKFTAIRYETEKYIRENERLFKERWWILSGTTILSFFLLLVYWNSRNSAKNKELLFEKEQQQYNEDMFLLALENKTTLERGRSLERFRISEDLHDGILARLFSVRFKWAFIDLFGSKESLRLHRDSIEQLTYIEKEIRNISHDLRNELIWNEMAFIDEIENTIKEKSELGIFKYSFQCEDIDAWEALDYFYKINVSRMLDETLQNVIYHAQATLIIVGFWVAENTFVISVEDNGKGFRSNSPKKGIGLKNLRSRAKKIDGEVSIASQLGNGTTIVIKFPKKD